MARLGLAGDVPGKDPPLSRRASPAAGAADEIGDAHLGNRLLSALQPSDFELLRPDLRVVELRQGDGLYEPGEPITSAYFPHGSMISLVAVLEEGETAEVAVYGREGVAGYLSSLVAENSFGRYLVQISGTASKISTARLVQAVHSSPTMQDVFSRYLQAILFQSFQTVACNALHSVERRFCRWLLATRDRAGRDDLPLTHDFLSEMLGVQRPTVSLIARTLQAAGLIEQGRGMIRVVDPGRLEESACCCYRLNRANLERLLPGAFR